jgi:hypothetical protein
LSNQPHRASSRRVPLTVAAIVFIGFGSGCAGVKQINTQTGSGGMVITGAGGTGFTGAGGSGVIMPASCNGPCTDFPVAPIIGVGVASDAPSKFGAPSGAGPCVTEPEDDTLFPNNWLRPRIRVPGNTGVLKITFHADKEANDLVAYASGETWALPKDIWMGLASHVVMEFVTVTVQLQSGGATMLKFRIAPVGAAGSMVFWSADPSQVGKMGVETMAQTAVVNDSILKGFTVGDEGTADTLKIVDVVQQVGTQNGTTQGSHCIGCHVGTPDGDFVAFVDSWPWAAAFAGVKPDPANSNRTGAAMPGFAGGVCTSWNACSTPRTFVQYPWAGPVTFSPAHWGVGDKKAIMMTQMVNITMPWATDNWQPGRLAWVDLESSATVTTNGQINPAEGQAFGYLARTGDPHPAAAFPNWSHDGRTIVYSSTACPSPGQVNGCGTQDGRLSRGQTDLYEIPYNNKAGGPATAVAGAATTAMEEYYPAYSPDDRLIAFTAVPSGQEMYANPSAELYVVRRGSTGTATKLRANTPPGCSGKASPGINNHWPKWSPDAVNVGGSTFYWVIFSSNRYGLPTVTTNFNGASKVVELSQLYITAIVVDEISVTTYPAIYLWNQPQNRLNTTPAWEHFHIPIVID